MPIRSTVLPALTTLLLLAGCTRSDTDNDGIADWNDCNPSDPSDVGLVTSCDCPMHVDAPEDCSENTDDDGDGFSENQGDCDDGDAARHPSADEVCDGVDNDCDGDVDGADADILDTTTYYLDSDGDGFGDPAVFIDSCDAPVGYAAQDGDCDDSTTAVHPGAPEDVCDGRDTDCDGHLGAREVDDDLDGFSECDDDCDDTNDDAHPGGTEDCATPGDEDCDLDADCADSDCVLDVSCCTDDAFEPNDDLTAAVDVGGLGSFSGTFCGGGDDYYVVDDLPYQTRVMYTVCPLGADVDLRWMRFNGQVRDETTVSAGSCGSVGFSTTAFDPEAVLHVVSAGTVQYDVQASFPSESPWSDCFDGLDHDGDGLIGCEDADCADLDRDGSLHAACESNADMRDCNDADPRVAGPGFGHFEADSVTCHDGIDNTCDGLVDCNDPGCAHSDPACLEIGCRPADQEPSELNDTVQDAAAITWGQLIDGATCVGADISDMYRLNGVAEGLQVRCVIDWPLNLGRPYFSARVYDASDPEGLGASAFGESASTPPLVVDVDVLDWQAGDWILQVRPLDDNYPGDSNKYSFRCIQTGGVPTETDCSDGVDQDFDNLTDCEDSDCLGDEDCPCETTDTITCDVPLTLDIGAGTDAYYRYPCTSNGHKGTERILSFTAPDDGDYVFSASVVEHGLASDDLDFHLIDGTTSCRYGTCLGSGNADLYSPSSSIVTLAAGEVVHFVLDGREGVSDDITATVAVSCPGSCADRDLDGYAGTACGGSDCDDGDPRIFPGALETCDYRDENCTSGDEPFVAQWRDQDGDGEGNRLVPLGSRCDVASGYVRNGLDCDDSRAAVSTLGTEVCDNNLDDDCDGSTDCDDADCFGLGTCGPGTCDASGALTCGSVEVLNLAGGTADHDASVCASGSYSGREKSYSYTALEDGRYTFYLLDVDHGDADLFVYDSCDPSVCLGASLGTSTSEESVTVDLEAGHDYLIVADQFGAGPSPTGLIAMDCNTGSEKACDDGRDNDLDGLQDCADSDCSAHPRCQTSWSGAVVRSWATQRDPGLFHAATEYQATFRTAIGQKYLRAVDAGGGEVDATADLAREWETWDLFDLDGGDLQSGDWVAIRAWDNIHYLGAVQAGGGDAHARAPTGTADLRPREWEMWRIQRTSGSGRIVSGDEIALRTWNQDDSWFLRALDGGGSGIDVRASAVSGWEAFDIQLSAPGNTWLAEQRSTEFRQGVPTAAIVVDTTERHQVIEGFGASITDASAELILDLTPSKQSELLDSLFLRTGGGIAMGATRIALGSSDMQSSADFVTFADSSTEDVALSTFSIAHSEARVLPVLREAVARNPSLTVVASPWTAPAWMKTTNSVSGGSLKDRDDIRDAWAEYFARSIEAFQASPWEIDVSYVTPQNEPLHWGNDRPSMLSTPELEAQFIGHHLGPLLAQRTPSVQILAYDHNWSEGAYPDAAYPLEVLGDSAAATYVDGVAFHCYNGQDGTWWDAQDTLHDAFSQAEIWVTECSSGPWETKDFKPTTPFQEKVLLMVETSRRASHGTILWNAVMGPTGGPSGAGSCDNCQGVVSVIPSTDTWIRGATFYSLAHFTRFVDRGAVRIGSESRGTDSSLRHVAFQNPDGSVVLVVVNTGGGARSFNVEWDGGYFSGVVDGHCATTFAW